MPAIPTRNHRLMPFLLLLTSASLLCAADPPSQPWWPQAPALPAPRGQEIRVSTVQQLFQAADEVQPGGTILVADGHYMMPRYFELSTDNVTLRSESGQRNAVVLDGAQSRHGELVGISKCRGVTIADLTIQNIKWNGFKINSNLHATHVTIRNCVIHNIWQRGVKGPAVDKRDRGTFWPTGCRIEYCLFYNDRPKQFSDDPADTPEKFQGNYVGGIDAMYARQWVIADNVFVGIHGRTGEGRGAVFLWNESRDCVVERNIIIDCDCGICLGNHYRHADARWHDRGCIVRNNLVTRCSETGILAAHTRDCQILHNTVHDPESRLRRLIWVQDDNDGLLAANNLLSGPELRDTGSSEIVKRDNVAIKDLSAYFVDAASGNLRLARPVSSVGRRFDEAAVDIDGNRRPARPMPGAHQLQQTEGALQNCILPASMTTQASDSEEDQPAWVEPMRRVHARFEGQEGYVAQFGDSITYSMAFWSPMGWTYPDKFLAGEDGLPKKPAGKRWRDILLGTRDKGPQFANYSGWRVGQLLKAMDDVLKRERPEVALIMIGTNDISGNRVPSNYGRQLAEVVDKCITAGCVPLLSTIPPRRGHEESVAEANRIIRDLARQKQVPLIDFYAECLQRRPGKSWDGTLISDDGVHPSGGDTHVFTEENLKSCGYALRNWVTFLMVRQVYFRVLHAEDIRDQSKSLKKPEPPSKSRETPQVVQDPQARGDRTWAGICSPRIVATGQPDTYSLKTFGQCDRWRDLPPDAKAYEVYRYLVDTQTGLFHMNVVAEGDDALSEFVQIRDPIKIINVYGYAYCGILGPTMAGVCEGIGLGPARTLVLPAWNHVAAESYYDDSWHYLDLDVRAVFRRSDGTLASLEQARHDATLWHGRGPLFFPNDPLEETRKIYEQTEVLTFYGFQQSGHTMDYRLRPGERFTRWWQPQGGRWHHLEQYNNSKWLCELLESPPRGPKPNHRHFTVHNHGNGRFVYEPKLTNQYSDFELGVYDHQNVTTSPDGLTLTGDGDGYAVFEVRSPYIIVPLVGKLDSRLDDREASVIEWEGTDTALSISLDNGLTWTPVSQNTGPQSRQTATVLRSAQAGAVASASAKSRLVTTSVGHANGQPATAVDLTSEVSGRYGYLLKVTLQGKAGEAQLSRLKMTTWVQVAPASLPALRQGRNQMRLITNDHYGLPTQVMETRSRASHPDQLLKYLVTPPRDYDPQRKTERIHGSIVARVTAAPHTKIAWFTATGQFRTHQQQNASKTKNRIEYAVGQADEFRELYRADVPTYTNHWNYNAASEVVLQEPAKRVLVRYTGDPALNNFAIYAHCVPDGHHVDLPLDVTHTWKESGELKSHTQTVADDGDYQVIVGDEPENISIELSVRSRRTRR